MSAQYDFVAGFDISSLPSVSQAQLMQMVNQLSVVDNIGAIVVKDLGASTTPIANNSGAPTELVDVINNPRFRYYICLNTNVDPPVPYQYNAGSDQWESTTIASGSISNTHISSSADIALSKLADGGGARYMMQMNSAGTAWTSVTIANAFQSGDNIVVGALVPNGSEGFLQTFSGVTQWRTSAQAASSIITAMTSLPLTKLDTATLAANYILGSTDGTTPLFAAPSTFIAANSLATTKLSQSSASTGQFLKWDGSNWSPASVPFSTTTGASAGVLDSTTMDNATTLHTFAHSLGAAPKMIRVVCRCTTTSDLNYTVGDEIEITGIGRTNGDRPYAIYSDATNVYVKLNTTNVSAIDKTAGTFSAMTLSKWTLKVYAWA